MLFDAGSPVTIISRSVYESLGPEKPELKSSDRDFRAVDGSKLRIIGKGIFDFETEVKEYKWTIFVTDIEGEVAIMGFDFINSKGKVLDMETLSWETKAGIIQLYSKTSLRVYDNAVLSQEDTGVNLSHNESSSLPMYSDHKSNEDLCLSVDALTVKVSNITPVVCRHKFKKQTVPNMSKSQLKTCTGSSHDMSGYVHETVGGVCQRLFFHEPRPPESV